MSKTFLGSSSIFPVLILSWKIMAPGNVGYFCTVTMTQDLL